MGFRRRYLNFADLADPDSAVRGHAVSGRKRPLLPDPNSCPHLGAGADALSDSGNVDLSDLDSGNYHAVRGAAVLLRKSVESNSCAAGLFGLQRCTLNPGGDEDVRAVKTLRLHAGNLPAHAAVCAGFGDDHVFL